MDLNISYIPISNVDVFSSIHTLLFHNILDSKSMLDASLTSSQYLARNPYIEISEQLDHQLTDVALCNIMYHSPLLVGCVL